MKRVAILAFIKRSTLVLSSAIVLFNTGMVAAQSITDQDVTDINHQTPWYDPNFGGCTTDSTATGTGNLVGGDNIEKAYNFFVQNGLKNFQSAGILGNLRQESGVNPKSNQSGGPGRGIAQWSEGGRWEALKKWVADASHFPDNKPRDPESLDGQLAFLWHEMKDVSPWNQTLPEVKAAQTVEQATQAFEESFEKAGIPNMPNRIKYAREVLNKFGGGTASTPATDQTNPDTGEAVSDCPAASAGNSQFVDGFVVYNQCDPAWGNKAYGSSRICPSGCGPSAMAMTITALTGQRVTPYDTATYAGAQGMYIPGTGSSWSVAPVVAKHWNLKAKFIGASVTKINAALNSGALVVGAGHGALPWTSGGHYIVIRAVLPNGKWKVGDSGHRNTSDKEWDPGPIVAGMGDGSVYAISK